MWYSLNIYQDSLLTKLHLNEDGNPISVSLTETFVVRERGIIQLSEFPDAFQRLQITVNNQPLVETQGSWALLENQFKVNYANGIVYFHPSQVGKTVCCRYYGRGVDLISTNRIFHNNNDEDVPEVLYDIVERGKETVDELTTLNTFLNEQETARQEQFDEAFSTLDDKILAEDNAFNRLHTQHEANHQTQLQEQEEAFQAQMTEQATRFETQFNTHANQHQSQITTQQQTFDEKVEEWDGLVLKLGTIDDDNASTLTTWSSEKIQNEFTQADTKLTTEIDRVNQNIDAKLKQQLTDITSTEATANTIVKRDSSGRVKAKSVVVDQSNELVGKTDGLYAKKGSVESKVILASDVSEESGLSTIAKRDSSGALRSIRFNAYASDGSIRGQYSADAKYRPTWVKQGSTSTSDREIILTSSDIPYYEVGTWTPKPMVENGSYIPVLNSSAKYCAIGNQVFVSGWFTWESLPSNVNGRLILRGLPLANSGNATVGNIGFRTGANLPSDSYHLFCEMPSNGTTGVPEVRFYCAKANGTGGNYNCTNLSTSGEIHFAITYVIG